MFPERTVPWPVAGADQITLDSLGDLTAEGVSVGLLVVGCGVDFQPAPDGLKEDLKDLGVALEWMDTGAACRTFNVLLAEDRPAAAALVAID